MKTAIAAAAVLSGLLTTNLFAQTSTGADVTSPSGSSSMKMSQTDCDAAWMKLDSGNTGAISQTQSQGCSPTSRPPTPTEMASSRK
jgi:hypothetical protein